MPYTLCIMDVRASFIKIIIHIIKIVHKGLSFYISCKTQKKWQTFHLGSLLQFLAELFVRFRTENCGQVYIFLYLDIYYFIIRHLYFSYTCSVLDSILKSEFIIRYSILKWSLCCFGIHKKRFGIEYVIPKHHLTIFLWNVANLFNPLSFILVHMKEQS